MRIESIDLFYLQMPDSDPAHKFVKDTLLVRVRGGQYEGWGECEAAPFVSLAAFITPESHSTSRPVNASLLGQEIRDPSDVIRIAGLVQQASANVLQAPHAFSGVEMALWDLLGKRLQEPVYRLLGFETALRKQPYVVVPFGPTPGETYTRVSEMHQRGIRAAKVGWGGFGCGDLSVDRGHLDAARKALGTGGRLFVDAAQIWGNSVANALQYRAIMDEFNIEWVEEPFHPTAVEAYAEFADLYGHSRVAAGEHIHTVVDAKRLLTDTKIGIIQIDCGRVGGIAAAHEIAKYAARRNIHYVNHTYTSHLALSASLQAFAGIAQYDLCEYPISERSMSWKISQNHLHLDRDGLVCLPEGPGLGIQINLSAVREYTQDLEVKLSGKVVYSTPDVLCSRDQEAACN